MPAFDADEVGRLAADDTTISITTRASDDAAALGFTNEDIRDVLSTLRSPRCKFYKSMPDDMYEGGFFDVYHVSIGGYVIYLKFRIGTRKYPPRDRCIVVTSFKEK